MKYFDILKLSGIVCLTSCMAAQEGNQRIEITETNELGVTSIEVQRFEQGGAVFELQGFDASANQRASVRLRTGPVADLEEGFGSEIILSVAGQDDVRWITREVELFHLPVTDSVTQGFLQLPAVSSTLERDAHIIFEKAGVDGDEAAYSAAACPSGDVLSSPVATQCCYGTNPSNSTYTMHVNPANAPTNPGKFVYRLQNPHGGAGCKASDGVSTCSGRLCYFGPAGFSTPSIGGTSPYWKVYTSSAVLGPPGTPPTYFCSATGYTSPQTPEYGNVNGTFPRNQGCPGSNPGPGFWDY